jgi:hypothetical protein
MAWTQDLPDGMVVGSDVHFFWSTGRQTEMKDGLLQRQLPTYEGMVRLRLGAPFKPDPMDHEYSIVQTAQMGVMVCAFAIMLPFAMLYRTNGAQTSPRLGKLYQYGPVAAAVFALIGIALDVLMVQYRNTGQRYFTHPQSITGAVAAFLLLLYIGADCWNRTLQKWTLALGWFVTLAGLGNLFYNLLEPSKVNVLFSRETGVLVLGVWCLLFLMWAIYSIQKAKVQKNFSHPHQPIPLNAQI